MKTKEIKFYPNSQDNKHCVQACLRMALGYFFRYEDYSYDKLDKITQHLPGYGTSLSAAMSFMAQKGLEVVNIENFNYHLFVQDGERYCQKIWSPDTLRLQKQIINLAHERKLARTLIGNKEIRLFTRQATIRDVIDYIEKGYLVMVSINPCVLSNQLGYWSHLVLVTDVSGNQLTFHDPGLPPRPDCRIDLKTFALAMTPPAKEDTSILAVRPRRTNNRKLLIPILQKPGRFF